MQKGWEILKVSGREEASWWGYRFIYRGGRSVLTGAVVLFFMLVPCWTSSITVIIHQNGERPKRSLLFNLHLIMHMVLFIFKRDWSPCMYVPHLSWEILFALLRDVSLHRFRSSILWYGSLGLQQRPASLRHDIIIIIIIEACVRV